MKDFTRIQNRILNILITYKFSQRQLKIILTIVRITSGCHVPKAIFRPADFRLTGIYTNAIGKELKRLKEMNIIQMNSKRTFICLNLNVNEWKIARNQNIDDEKLTDLMRSMISKQLRHRSVLATLVGKNINDDQLNLDLKDMIKDKNKDKYIEHGRNNLLDRMKF